MTPEGTLIIRKAIPRDAGIYGCLASNSAGTEKQTSTLTYIGKQEKQCSEVKKNKLIHHQGVGVVKMSRTVEHTCRNFKNLRRDVEQFKNVSFVFCSNLSSIVR